MADWLTITVIALAYDESFFSFFFLIFHKEPLAYRHVFNYFFTHIY